jgi:hypothetical protein
MEIQSSRLTTTCSLLKRLKENSSKFMSPMFYKGSLTSKGLDYQLQQLLLEHLLSWIPLKRLFSFTLKVKVEVLALLVISMSQTGLETPPNIGAHRQQVRQHVCLHWVVHGLLLRYCHTTMDHHPLIMFVLYWHSFCWRIFSPSVHLLTSYPPFSLCFLHFVFFSSDSFGWCLYRPRSQRLLIERDCQSVEFGDECAPLE